MAWLVIGAAIAASLYASAGFNYFYQFFSPEIVYAACGLGWIHPGQLSPELLQFLTGEIRSFDCAMLPADATGGPIGVFTQGHLYLMATVSLLWRIFGVDYANLWPLPAVLFSAYVVGCYHLARLFFPTIAANVATAVIAFAPAGWGVLGYLRDFSKAPFFIWALVLIITGMRADKLPETALRFGAAGLLIGIGAGFRGDVTLLLPMATILILVGRGPGRWLNRAVGLAALVIAFQSVSWPLAQNETRTAAGAMLMEGLSAPFNRYLSMGEVPYNFGTAYSDELTFSSIAADLRPERPTWDQDEPSPIYGLSQALSESTEYFISWGWLIPADLATRALKSASWILGYPAAVDMQRLWLDPAGNFRSQALLVQLLQLPYDLVGGPWLPIFGVVAFVAWFLREQAGNLRESLGLFLVWILMLGYPSAQFSMRHTFNLEFLWLFSAIGLVLCIWERRRVGPHLVRGLAIVGTLSVLVVTACTGLVLLQQRLVVDAVDGLLSLKREEIAISRVEEGDLVRLTVPVPDDHADIVVAPLDAMAGDALPIAAQWDVRAEADTLILTFEGSECQAGTAAVAFSYTQGKQWQSLNSTVDIVLGAGQTRVIQAAYYRPSQHLDAILLSKDASKCLANVERVLGRSSLPSVFGAVLPPGWQEQSWYLGFGMWW